MNTSEIWQALVQAERRARSTKWKRLITSPWRYPALMAFNKVIYPLFGRGMTVTARPFFGIPMRTQLPSGTDILLNGIKSHDSEIRLSKFFCRHIQDGDTIIDVGAHYGYYSLLASVLAGPEGKVYSVEASAASFPLLLENTSSIPNIFTYHRAASDTVGELIFYEYPGPLAEYNTMNREAYRDQAWYQKTKETVNRVKTLVLDQLLEDEKISKAVIKIDAEGGELSVLRGLERSLEHASLTIVMEFLIGGGSDSPHQQSLEYIQSKGYSVYIINADGALESASDPTAFLKQRGIDSDNVVLMKRNGN